MTVRINFLPRNYQPPKQMGAKEWGIAVAAAVVVAGTGIFYGGVYASTAGMESVAMADETKLANVQAQLALADDIKQREQRVAQAEAELKSLSGRHWSSVLLDLRELTPQHVAWTSIQAVGSDLTLKGTSRGLVDVAQLMGGLVTDTSIDQVQLKFINEKGVPVSVYIKPKDAKDAKGGAAQAVTDALKEMPTVRQLEFEMIITLVPAEGGQLPHGA